MWTRAKLKSDAKDFLRKYWKRAVIVSLIGFMISSALGSKTDMGKEEINKQIAQRSYERVVDSEDQEDTYQIYLFSPSSNSQISVWKSLTPQMGQPSIPPFRWLSEGVRFVVKPTVFLSVAVLSVIFSIFIANPILLGVKYFYRKGYEEEPEIRDILYAFQSGRYGQLVIKLLLKNVYLVLWTLLFVIPGIYKTYQYWYVEYILLDHPEFSLKEAIELSKEMTEGDKLNIFILELSFIGWILVSALFFSIPDLILNPYMSATYAKLYLVRKAEFSSKEDLTATQVSQNHCVQ